MGVHRFAEPVLILSCRRRAAVWSLLIVWTCSVVLVVVSRPGMRLSRRFNLDTEQSKEFKYEMTRHLLQSKNKKIAVQVRVRTSAKKPQSITRRRGHRDRRPRDSARQRRNCFPCCPILTCSFLCVPRARDESRWPLVNSLLSIRRQRSSAQLA